MFLNGTVITKQYLYQWLKDHSFINAGKNQAAILNIMVDGKSTYGSLVGIYEQAYRARLDFTNEQVRVKFNRPYHEEESRYSDEPVWEFSKTLRHPLLQFDLLKTVNK